MNRFGETANEPRAMAAGRLALLGGRIALDLSGQFLSGWKPDGSLVTNVDMAIQARLCTEIKSVFPQDGILAEEGEVSVTWPPDARYWWVLDPLDGTANFAQGIPGFSISVGVLRDGMPFVGAVYDPTADWLYTACLAHGAWLNGRRLQIQPQPLSARSVMSIRTPFENQVPSYVLRWLCRHRLRRFGSTALQLCYVASGALSLVHDQRAFLWDLAGAAVVVAEAGGVLTRPDGSALFPFPPAGYRGEPIAFLAGDPLGHAEGVADITDDSLAVTSRMERAAHGD